MGNYVVVLHNTVFPMCMYLPFTLLWECVIVWFLLCAFLLLVYVQGMGRSTCGGGSGWCEGGGGLIVMYLCV